MPVKQKLPVIDINNLKSLSAINYHCLQWNKKQLTRAESRKSLEQLEDVTEGIFERPNDALFSLSCEFDQTKLEDKYRTSNLINIVIDPKGFDHLNFNDIRAMKEHLIQDLGTNELSMHSRRFLVYAASRFKKLEEFQLNMKSKKLRVRERFRIKSNLVNNKNVITPIQLKKLDIIPKAYKSMERAKSDCKSFSISTESESEKSSLNAGTLKHLYANAEIFIDNHVTNTLSSKKLVKKRIKKT